MRVLAGRDSQADGHSVDDRDFVAVAKRAATGRANGQIPEIPPNVARCYGSAGLPFGFHSPLLDGVIDDFQIVDARHHPRLLASVDVTGDRECCENADKGDDDHDFNERETMPAAVTAVMMTSK